MATVIAIDPKRRRNILLLAATLVFLPPAESAEPEIYVTTGPDGVEIFSNLPRGPLAVLASPATPAPGRAVIVATQSARNGWSAMATAGVQAGIQGGEAEEQGKSFLFDD